MTLKWNLERYIELLKKFKNYDYLKEYERDPTGQSIDPELFECNFYENCIQAYFEYKDCQRYSTILHSFLAYEIDIERLTNKFILLRRKHFDLTEKTIEKIKKSIDLSLPSEELDLQIEWEPEFQILSDKIDYLYQMLDSEVYYFDYERNYKDKFSINMYVQIMIYERISIFKKLS